MDVDHKIIEMIICIGDPHFSMEHANSDTESEGECVEKRDVRKAERPKRVERPKRDRRLVSVALDTPTPLAADGAIHREFLLGHSGCLTERDVDSVGTRVPWYGKGGGDGIQQPIPCPTEIRIMKNGTTKAAADDLLQLMQAGVPLRVTKCYKRGSRDSKLLFSFW